MAIGLGLAVDAFVVDVNFEHTTTRWHEDQLTDVVAELGEQLGRQTDGTVAVPSEVAVLDADAHDRLLDVGLPSILPPQEEL